MKRSLAFLSALAALCLVAPGANAQQLLSADQVYKQLAIEPPPVPSGRSTSFVDWHSLLTIPPEQAAVRWLDGVKPIFDHSSSIDSGIVNMNLAFRMLPQPAAWSKIEEGLAAMPQKRAIVLVRVLFNVLQGKRPQALSLLSSPQISPKDANKIRLDLALDGGTSDEIAAALVKDAKTEVVTGFDNPSFPSSIQAPDLTKDLGADRYKALLKTLLATSMMPLSFNAGDSGADIARAIIVADPGSLKSAQYALVEGPLTIPVFESINKEFPQKQPDGYGPYTQASEKYFIALISKGEEARAVAFAKAAKSMWMFCNQCIGDISLSRKEAMLLDALEQVLVASPASYSISASTYWYLAQSMGTQDRADAFLTNHPKIGDPSDKAAWRSQRLLEANDWQGAAKALEDGIKASSNGTGSYLSQRLFEIGELHNRPDIENAALRVVNHSGADDIFSFAQGWAPHALVRLDRGEEAESIYKKLWQDALAKQPDQASQVLPALLRLYGEAGRDSDVLTLTDHAKLWSEQDLSKIDQYPSPDEVPLAYYVAKALATAGRKEEGLRVLRFCIQQSPNLDAAYRLLVKSFAGETEAAVALKTSVLAAIGHLGPDDSDPFASLDLSDDWTSKTCESALAGYAPNPDGELGGPDPEGIGYRNTVGYFLLDTRAFDKAQAAFEESTRVGPEQLTGWSGLLDVSEQKTLPRDELNHIYARLATLGPTFRYPVSDYQITDFASLWTAASTTLSFCYTAMPPIYPLHWDRSRSGSYSTDGQIRSPGDFLKQDPAVADIIHSIDSWDGSQ